MTSAVAQKSAVLDDVMLLEEGGVVCWLSVADWVRQGRSSI